MTNHFYLLFDYELELKCLCYTFLEPGFNGIKANYLGCVKIESKQSPQLFREISGFY